MEWKSVWEGVSIILVSVFLIAIIAVSDYQKDKQFIKLSNNIKEEWVPVIRGKFGITHSISIWDVVVGDIILLETGDSVPADCLIIEQTDLQVDEPFSEDADGRYTKPSNYKSEEDPVLYAGSIIKKGQCKAIVCCVGIHSTRGIIEKKLDTDQDTAVQIKLKNLEKKFIKFAAFACFIVLVLTVIMLIIKMSGDETWYKVLF
jgi:Ca2+-transporting ATPase